MSYQVLFDRNEPLVGAYESSGKKNWYLFNRGLILHVSVNNSLRTVLTNVLSRIAFPSELPSTFLLSALGYFRLICLTIFLKMCYMKASLKYWFIHKGSLIKSVWETLCAMCFSGVSSVHWYIKNSTAWVVLNLIGPISESFSVPYGGTSVVWSR